MGLEGMNACEKRENDSLEFSQTCGSYSDYRTEEKMLHVLKARPAPEHRQSTYQGPKLYIQAE